MKNLKVTRLLNMLSEILEVENMILLAFNADNIESMHNANGALDVHIISTIENPELLKAILKGTASHIKSKSESSFQQQEEEEEEKMDITIQELLSRIAENFKPTMNMDEIDEIDRLLASLKK